MKNGVLEFDHFQYELSLFYRHSTRLFQNQVSCMDIY